MTASDHVPVGIQARRPVSRRSSAALELHDAGSGARLSRDPAGAAGNDEPDLATVAAAFQGFLESLGLDLDDPNLVGTDERVARAYRELLGGLRPGAEPRVTTFPNTEAHTGIIAVTGIPFYSMCAHHFLPFFGVAHLRGTRTESSTWET